MKSTKTRRAERLGERLALLPYLLEGRRWSQKELMDYFGVDRKTIVSSIDALTHPGLPNLIVEEREGRHVYYRLNDEYIARCPTRAFEYFFSREKLRFSPSQIPCYRYE